MKKKIKIFVHNYILSYIIYLYIKLLEITCKLNFDHPVDKPKDNFLLLMWHRELLLQSINHKRFVPEMKLKGMMSEHRDGVTIRNALALCGVDHISGSSTRGGAKAVINSIKSIKNKISNVAITPDGPRGPLYSIAPGAALIALKSNAKIYVAHYKCSSFWELNSWDKHILPKPFSELNFCIKGPIDVCDLSIEKANEVIKKHMMENIDGET